jgi:hypothetical protein
MLPWALSFDKKDFGLGSTAEVDLNQRAYEVERGVEKGFMHALGEEQNQTDDDHDKHDGLAYPA